MSKRDVMEQAFHVLVQNHTWHIKRAVHGYEDSTLCETNIAFIQKLRAELEKPETKLTVVAWMHPVYTSMIETHKFNSDCVPLYRKEEV